MELKRRGKSRDLIDYFVARLICRFIDHGESLEDSAAIAEFWCHQIAAECAAGFKVSVLDGAFEAEALSGVSASQATIAYLRYAATRNIAGRSANHSTRADRRSSAP